MTSVTQVTAKRMFVALVDGETVVVPEGARFPTTSPIVKANPEHFEPARRASRKR